MDSSDQKTADETSSAGSPETVGTDTTAPGPHVLVNLMGRELSDDVLEHVQSAGKPVIVTSDLDSGVGQQLEGRVLVLLEDPVDCLVGALTEGRPISEALADWRDRTAETLSELRKHRRRVDVIVLPGPDSPSEVLAHRILRTLAGPSGDALASSDDDRATALDAPLWAIGLYALYSDPNARTLMNEVSAVMPQGERDRLSPLGLTDRAFAEVTLQRRELEHLDVRHREQSAVLALAEAERASALKRAHEQAETSACREGVLGAAMLERSASLDALQHQLGAEEETRHAQQEEIDRLNQQLDSVYASTSWKVTGPLRALGRLLRRR